MSKKLASRYAQNVKAVEFTWNYDDTIVNASGATVDFGKTTTGIDSIVADVIELPPGAVVVGGHVVTDTAFDTAGYDIEVGDATTDNRYKSTSDMKGTGLAELVPTGLTLTTGGKIRLTIGNDDACSAGKATLRVLYVIKDRADEVTS